MDIFFDNLRSFTIYFIFAFYVGVVKGVLDQPKSETNPAEADGQ